MKTILLTGGSSFIGRNILESYLCQKYTIIAPTHEEVDWSNEYQVLQFFSKHDTIDIILHGAFANNLEIDMRMFSNILKHRSLNTFLYNFSSGSLYDNTRSLINITEDAISHSPTPLKSAAYGKYLMYELSGCYKKVCHLAIFGIFGMYEKPYRLITNSFNRLAAGQDTYLDGIRKMSFIYIKDFIKVIDALCAEPIEYNLINVAYSDAYLLNIDDHIHSLFGYRPTVMSLSKSEILPEYTASTDLLRSLNCCAPMSLYDAITDYYNIWRKDV